MTNWLNRLLGVKEPAFRVVETPTTPGVLVARSCFEALLQCLDPANQRRHEGIAYLLGRTDGILTVCLHAVRPLATTTAGSFHVASRDMAKVVGLADDLGLQVVAQVHTHPQNAFHSDGDEDGSNIKFDGFVSVVIPDYGARLPSLDGTAVYLYRTGAGWSLLPVSAVRVIDPGTAFS